MCEFTVVLETGTEKKQVAKNVVKAKVKEGKIVLMDSVGGVTRVENAAITVVDTLMAEMVLRSNEPILVSPSDISTLVGGQQGSSAVTVRLPKDLEALRAFHGHLGPYVTLGFRMGKIAREKYPHRIYATLFSGTKRPLSCVADGVQLASCCTSGKGNIIIREGEEAKARFTDGRAGIEIKVLPEVLKHIDASGITSENEDAYSVDVYRKKAEDLFSVTPVEPGVAWHGFANRQ